MIWPLNEQAKRRACAIHPVDRGEVRAEVAAEEDHSRSLIDRLLNFGVSRDVEAVEHGAVAESIEREIAGEEAGDSCGEIGGRFGFIPIGVERTSRRRDRAAEFGFPRRPDRCGRAPERRQHPRRSRGTQT